eukprot:TRINITY_DN11649_c0_g1_i1.p1 TRINITY_DN11649_c0_g1~~TRINITY_DN11649_c0_g1_i1.p1  ORF type:complete len:203 (-),score=62.81 TRINITY_DN11649_c0_g1_i1:349-957(-)
MTSRAALFQVTSRFKEAVALINSAANAKFPLLLSRIIQKLHLRENIFSEAELEQLQELLQLSPADLQTVLDACSYIFEQLAYFGGNADILVGNLRAVKVDEDKIQGFVATWSNFGQDFVAKLRSRTIGFPHELIETKWDLHLQMSQSDLTRVNETRAIFELALGDSETGKKADKVLFECSQSDLFRLYEKLEVLQQQLDRLA